MKKMARNLTTAILSAVTLALAGVATPSGAPENPATGIWIQQIGEIVEQPSTNATLYYTKYIGTDRRVEGKGEAAYNKEKAIYEKALATVKSYYEKAKPYLEHLRELTPDDAKRWASPLQMVYSTLNMTEQAKEMDALLEAANNR